MVKNPKTEAWKLGNLRSLGSPPLTAARPRPEPGFDFSARPAHGPRPNPNRLRKSAFRHQPIDRRARESNP